MKSLLKVLGALVLLVIVAIVGLALLAHHPLPNEAEIIALYQANAEAYEKRTDEIRETLKQKKSPGPIRDEKLGYFAIEARNSPFSVLYYTHSSGIGVGAYGTGLAYLTQVPNPVYRSFKEMREAASKVEGFRGYGSINGRWYYALWEVD